MTILTCSLLQNINTVAAGAVAGDTIKLAGGVHTLAPILIEYSTHAQGTSGAGVITITSADDEQATISYNGWVAGNKAYQVCLWDMSYWIIDNVDIANFTGQGLMVWAYDYDSTGCQCLNMNIYNQTHNAAFGTKSGVGLHNTIVGGSLASTGSPTATLRDFTAQNIAIKIGRASCRERV